MDNETTGEDQSPFANLVGEGKKFKTPEDLAKGKLAADDFIQRLQQELAEKEQELTTLRVQKEVNSRTTTETKGNSQTSQNPGDVEALIEKKLKEARQSELRETNLRTSEKFLTESYGDNAKKTLENQAREMGIEVTKLLDIAADTPAVFKKLFQGPEKKLDPNVTSGTTNSEAADLNREDTEQSDYKNLSDQRRKQGANKFFSDPRNLQSLIAAKKKELAQANRE